MRVLFCCGLLISCLGCGGKENGSESKQSVPMPVTLNADLFGGRYFLEIETLGSVSMSTHMDHRANGNETVAQLADYEWGTNKLKIDMGVLTFNGKDLGKLEKGDRVRVDKENHLTVNGKERP